MQNKKRTSLYIVLISITLVLIGGSIWLMNAVDTIESKEDAAVSSKVLPTQQMPDTYDPNVDANGRLVTSNDVERVRQELLDAGLPADKFAPSDIKKIIVKSSTQGMDVITYARENFHGN
ncbi:hypothetical protein OIT44_03130 [Weissella ceti]|uniref:Uncharacterized protein n=1 Tax=Weissella ceti TaxID=759620 RepID=A0ABT3E3Y5_9LACO|nr:hypothetical protein [Weissella ceti]MCW0953065.1 hypothetical protein [Weissella ceti]QVK11608.1 hypothetical protein KHQ31_05140 [Weissella ceti]